MWQCAHINEIGHSISSKPKLYIFTKVHYILTFSDVWKKNVNLIKHWDAIGWNAQWVEIILEKHFNFHGHALSQDILNEVHKIFEIAIFKKIGMRLQKLFYPIDGCHWIYPITKGQKKSKWFFQVDVSSKKQTNEFYFLLWNLR